MARKTATTPRPARKPVFTFDARKEDEILTQLRKNLERANDQAWQGFSEFDDDDFEYHEYVYAKYEDIPEHQRKFHDAIGPRLERMKEARDNLEARLEAALGQIEALLDDPNDPHARAEAAEFLRMPAWKQAR